MLEAADLTLDYPDFHAVYTLSVPAGALCGLIGPSGGGKTTLLHAIAGFEIADRRARSACRARPSPLTPAERPLSILFQDHNLFPHLTAFENVGLGIDPRLRLDAAGRAASARPRLRGSAWTASAARRPAELSGGQRQRVAHRPRAGAEEAADAARRAVRRARSRACARR